MDFSRLTRGHIWIIGLVIAVILGAGFYFLGISRTKDNLTQLAARRDTADQTIGKRRDYEADLKKAKLEVAEAERAFRVFTNTKMPKPPIDLRNQDHTAQVRAMMNLWQEPKRLYDMAQNFALNTDKVAVRTQFGIPAPPADPKMIPTTIIEIPIGTVTAYGDLRSILDYMRRWNQFGRVVAVDGLQLSGVSPLLTGTAQLTAYIFPVVNPGQEQQAAADTNGYGGYGPGGYGGPGGPGGYGPPGGPGGYGPPGGPGGAPNGP
jgi:hypothetical protein